MEMRTRAKKELGKAWLLRPFKYIGPQKIVLCSSSILIMVCVFFYGSWRFLCPPPADGTGASNGFPVIAAACLVMASAAISIALYVLMLWDHRIRAQAFDRGRDDSKQAD